LRRALDDEPDDTPRPWKPVVDDELVGRVVRREQLANKFNPELPTECLVVHTDDGDARTVFCNHIVLRNKILKLDPQVGDRIAIRRQADDPFKGYARYKVVIERAADQATPPLPLTEDDIPF
jgi:hypothetical protein